MNSDEFVDLFIWEFNPEHLLFINEQLEEGAEVSTIRKDLWKCVAQQLNTKDAGIKQLALDILHYVAMANEHVIKSLAFLQLPQRMFNIISCERNAKLVTSAVDLLVEMLRDKPLVCSSMSTTCSQFIESAIFVLEKASCETEYFVGDIEEQIETDVRHLVGSALQLFSVSISVFDPGIEHAEQISALFEDFMSDDRYRAMTIQAMYTVSYYQPSIAATCFSGVIPCIMHDISSIMLPLNIFENCIGVITNFADFSPELATEICLSKDFLELPVIPESKNSITLITTLLKAAVETENPEMLDPLRIKCSHFIPVIFDGFSDADFSQRVATLRLAHQMLETADMAIISCLFPENSPDFVHSLVDMAESLDREVLELCAESILMLLRIDCRIDVKEILLSYDVSDIVDNSEHCTSKTVLAFQCISEILNTD